MSGGDVELYIKNTLSGYKVDNVTGVDNGWSVVETYYVTAVSGTGRPVDGVTVLQQFSPSLGTRHPYMSTIQVTSLELKPKGTGWEVTATYTRPKSEHPEENAYGEKWEWSISGEQVHITSVARQSDQDCYPYEKSTTSIGVHGDEVEGVDVYRPHGELHVTKRILRSNLTISARRTIWALTGCVNNSGFFDWYPGEVLYLGADISPTEDDEYTVTHKFLIGRNQSSPQTIELVNGDTFSLASVEAWDYVWFEMASRVDPGANKTGILTCNVAKVYPRANLNSLGLHGP